MAILFYFRYILLKSQMKKIVLFVSILFTVFILNVSLLFAQANQKSEIIKKISFQTLQAHLQNTEDTVFVVNFWATWCRPCVAELPDFQSVFKQYNTNKPVRFLMVNLDFPDNYARMVRFVHARADFPPTVWLDDSDYNAWISKVELGWAGEIPATLIYNNHQKYRLFLSGSISRKKLINGIDAGLSK